MQEAFENMLFMAMQKKASDIHIVLKKDCSLSFRVSGKMQTYKTLPTEEGKKIINYIRFISNINMNYVWRPQTGYYQWKRKENTCSLRVSSLPSYQSDSIVIRLLNVESPLTLETVTCLPNTRNFLKKVITKRQGLCIISGATGSGKSTTLYTLLDAINRQNRNIITLEDPIEIHKEYCLQLQMNEEMEITYETTLKQVMRHDPDVIMIGEIRDKKTAMLAIQCALTGHLVLTTLHAGDCITTIQRLLHFGISPLDLKETLIGVIAQIMLHDTKHKKPVVLSEFMNQKTVHSYLLGEPISYMDYQQQKEYIVNHHYISKEEVENFL